MKRDFFDILFKLMQTNKDIYIIFCGLGYPRVEEFEKEFGDRALNVEASEQTALDIATGLAYEGKIPFAYTITPFLLRGWETIRTYIDHENLHCVLIGAGVGNEYSEMDGFSHEAGDIEKHFDLMANFNQYYPNTKEQLGSDILDAIRNKKPSFINIHK